MELEIAKSEFQRTLIMLGAFIVGLIFVIANYFILDRTIVEYYGGTANYFTTVAWVIVMIAYELVILFLIARMVRKRMRLSYTFKVVHSFIEVTFPGVVLFYMVDVQGMLSFVDSAVVFLYTLFIILSVLHLDFKINVLVGLLAALQYAGIVYYGFHFANVKDSYRVTVPENSLYLRSMVMLICAAAAGFVSEEVKRRIKKAFDWQQQKQDMQELLGQQVSHEVAEALVADRASSRKQEATVLALDLRDFTRFAEYRTPDEIHEFQNKIFGPILDVIHMHQGIVNQIMGDGLMATFGTPNSNPLHADMAFQAALSILHKVKELCTNGIIPETRVGIGLHSGVVITGNIGSKARKQYSISGSAVIIAFRVEQLTKELDSELLITEEVKNRILVGKATLTSLGAKPLKGFGTSMNIYRVEV
jgi:adenylate cyclase